jgi:death-on-curing protein
VTTAKEPDWVLLNDVLAIHEELLAVHGGLRSVRDLGLLESALSRPRNIRIYKKADIATLAAAYADGIVSNYPFVDGNKRTGFVSAVLFLEFNGLVFSAAEDEVVTMFLGLADKKISRDEIAKWLAKNSHTVL